MKNLFILNVFPLLHTFTIQLNPWLKQQQKIVGGDLREKEIEKKNNRALLSTLDPHIFLRTRKPVRLLQL